MKKISKFKVILIAAIIGAVVGSGVTFILLKNQKVSDQELIKNFYLTENAVHVSPHTVRKNMDKGKTDFALVDLRSPQEYEKEHIIGAVNIPAYKDPNTSISLDTEIKEKERVIQEFRNLSKDKEVIVYCYSMPCMTGRKIGKLLADNDIYVKHLGIGWNEWRYFWSMWNHDGETPTKVENYIISGKDPGVYKPQQLPSPCGKGELSC